ncbi:DNA-binding transcriptional regulator, LysR family [Sporobacter termitidis DSM 10068]|uniref:DNA-binding transcriptional regulator, LysR family n=1 Tax=Sporobacter termitidis DSM 10068 TaxID=1123282 RepID=A0A1M5ZD49_9FIRM|nr:LysR family transcriptional regulator [Sporobacter termitidis]SHI22136.1 DNA-binding transcriptional regulator, LysR family [Sporobacter termitidis DSM 10068]
MTLRHYQIFVAVCDAMNMTAAAESLFMSQPAVSQAIAELEKNYEVRLFERLSRKLYLTEAGEKLLGYARHMLRMNDDVEKDMKLLRESGTIRLGASVTVGAYVLPRLVSAFKEENRRTAVRVVEDNTRQIEHLIMTDQLDFGIVEGDTVSPDIVVHPLMDDELTLVCARTHRFAGLSAVMPEELEKEDFIVREKGSGTRKTFEDTMALNGLSWREAWTCNNADTIRAAVAAGLGVSVISARAVARDAASGLLCALPVKALQFRRTFKIVYHKNKFLTVPMRKFMELCMKSRA